MIARAVRCCGARRPAPGCLGDSETRSVSRLARAWRQGDEEGGAKESKKRKKEKQKKSKSKSEKKEKSKKKKRKTSDSGSSDDSSRS